MRLRHLLTLAVIAAAPAFGAYSYSRPIVVPAASVTASLTNFPLIIHGTYPYLATIANGGSVTSSSGYDIVVGSNSGCSTLLNFERPLWNAATGETEIIGEVSLSSTAATTIYLCYGNSAVTTQQWSTIPWDANYVTAAHMEVTAPSMTGFDETGTLTYTAAGSPSTGRGQIARSWLLPNGPTTSTFSALTSGAVTAFQVSTSATFEVWVNAASLKSNTVPTGLITYGKSSHTVFSMQLRDDGTGVDRQPGFAIFDGTSFSIAQAGTIFPGQWYHVVGVVTAASQLALYVNGVQIATQAISTSPAAGDAAMGIAIGQDIFDTSPQSYLDGAVDEVRVSNIARSAAWIKAEYVNTADPTSFYSIGPPLANSGNFTNVSVVGATNTQAIVSFAHPSVQACFATISQDSGLASVSNDTNTALFASSNLVTRDSANLITGNTTAKIVYGKRYAAQYASDGQRYSRALEQNSSYYYDLNCGGDEFEGALRTAPIAMGNTYSEGVPPDSTTPGGPAWPQPVGVQRCNTKDLNCSNVGRDTRYVDTQTGVLYQHLVMPSDQTIENSGIQPYWYTGTGWSIPANWNTNGSNASITGSTNPLVVGSWNNICCGTGFSNAFGSNDVLQAQVSYQVPVMLQYSVTASTSNSACTGTNDSPDCRLDACVTTNWVSCDANAQLYQQDLSTTPTQYTFGSGQIYDTLQKPGKTIWNGYQTNWRGGPVTCDGSANITRVNDGNGSLDPVQAPAGSWMLIAGTPQAWYQITANQDALHLTVNAACPSGTWNIVQSAFGILTWKETTSADTILLSSSTIHTFAGLDEDPQHYSGFYGATQTVSLANGGPAGILSANQGDYSINLKNGKVRPFEPANPNNGANEQTAQLSVRLDGAGDQSHVIKWVFDPSTNNLSKWQYTGTFDPPISKVNLPNLPMWEWNSGAWLPTCSSTITNNCETSLGTVTNKGLDLLLNDFDPTYVVGPTYSINVTIPSSVQTVISTSSSLAGITSSTGLYIYGAWAPSADPVTNLNDTSHTLSVWHGVGNCTSGCNVSWLISPNPFTNWIFNSIENNQLVFDVRWVGAPGQAYWGWQVIFDPYTSTNVNGLYGAGCVAHGVTNPLDPYYHAPGCIVGARRNWGAPGARWMVNKEPGQMLQTGWATTESSIYAFGGDGAGPAVAQKTSLIANVTCPGGSGFTTCVQFTVDGDPFDVNASTGSRGALGTYMVGDYAKLGDQTWDYPGGPVLYNSPQNLLQLVAISGTTLTWGCVNPTQCYPSDTNPQNLWMYNNWPGFNYPWASGGIVDVIMWDFADDPHGTNASGNTVITDYSSSGAHGTNGNGKFTQGGTNAAQCTANQGCYNNQDFSGLSNAAFASNMQQQTRNNVTGNSALMSSFAKLQGFNGACGNNNCQTHPDYTRLNPPSAHDPLSSVIVDGRPFIGIGGIPFTADITCTQGAGTPGAQCTVGQLYKIANATNYLHQRGLNTQVTSARRVRRNVTGTGSLIPQDSTGSYEYCFALHAGECRPGSTAFDFYVNVPYLVTNLNGSGSACYDPTSGFATNASDNWTINDLCIYDVSMEAQNDTRYTLNGFDMVGKSEQALGRIFANGRSSIFTAIHPATNITDTTYNQYYWLPAQSWDGTFMTMLMKAPPVVLDSTDRTTFQPLVVNVTKPAGVTGYAVEFGYAEYGADGNGLFECSPNRHNDPCLAISASVNETTPFLWESEAPSLPASGNIAIPALPEHIVYYRPVYYSGASIVGRGAIQAAVIR